MLNPTIGTNPATTKARPVIDDGVTKFKLTLKRMSAPQAEDVLPIEKWRAILWRLNLIGEYPSDGVGFGNLSQRLSQPKNAFIITGTQTGKYPHLKREHYTRVVSCDLQRNTCLAEGPIAPSSESLTHYAIYESHPQIGAVFHVHHTELWERLIQQGAPSVDESVAYGTKDMADAANRTINGASEGYFVMKGHQDGLVSYGPTPEIAGKILLKLYRELGPTTIL